jgi:hypothetical protein
MIPTASAPNNKDWSILPNGTISWKTPEGKDVHFSTKVGAGNKVFAEICSTYGHPDGKGFVPGTAKAYFVKAKST